MVESINQGICESNRVDFKHFVTGGYYEQGKKLWVASHHKTQTLLQAVTLCNQLHQTSPFLHYNGATFVMIMRSAIMESDGFRSDREQEIIRSAAGHVIAGTAEGEELKRLLDFDRDR